MIEDYITRINEAIQSCLNVPCQIHGLSESCLTGEEENFLPGIIDENGDVFNVFIDDDYRFGCYHKLVAKTYQNATNKGYGDAPKSIQIVDMNLICWAFNAKAEKLEQLIYSVVPSDVKFTSSDFDKIKIFKQEIKGFDAQLAPEVTLFSIKYRVQYQVSKACVDTSNIFN